jgi:integral membrane protein (TIGR01906 family)
MRSAPNRRHALVAISAFIVALGLAVSVLLMPWFTYLLVPASGAGALTGLSEARVRAVAEEVRFFVSHRDAPALPAVVDGAPGFDESSVSHLEDVRDVVIGARWVTLLATLILGVTAAEAVSRGELMGVSGGLRTAGWSTLGAVLIAAAAGTLDFDTFFSAFHGVFFEAGTWTFPADALIIRVFPLPFWSSAAVAWAVLSLLIAAMLIAAGFVGRRVARGMPAE